MTWTWSNNVPQVDKIRQLLSLNWWLTILNFEISGSPWSSVPLDLPPTKLSKPKILKLPFIQGEDAIMAKLYSHFRIAIFVILYVCLFESSNKSRIYLSNIWYLFNYNTFSYDLASRSLDEWIALGYPRCSYLMNGIVLNRPKLLHVIFNIYWIIKRSTPENVKSMISRLKLTCEVHPGQWSNFLVKFGGLGHAW